MIDYQEIKKKMEIRGIEFTNTQFSFTLMIAIGINKYDAYKLSIVSDKINKIKEDKLSEFEDKCKKDCDILIEQNNIKQLIDYLKDQYEMQVNERLIDTSESRQLTTKQLKDISTRLILKYNNNLDNASATDLLKAMSDYMKNFPPDVEDGDFQHHFVQILPNFNFVCNVCGREGDAPMGVDFKCKHCGKLYKWSEEDKRYY